MKNANQRPAVLLISPLSPRTLTGKPDESFGDVHSEDTTQILRTAWSKCCAGLIVYCEGSTALGRSGQHNVCQNRSRRLGVNTEVGLPVTASLSILVYGSGYALPSSLLLVLFDAPRLVDVLQELAQLQDTEVSQRFFDFV
jgi:hypothetical protein